MARKLPSSARKAPAKVAARPAVAKASAAPSRRPGKVEKPVSKPVSKVAKVPEPAKKLVGKGPPLPAKGAPAGAPPTPLVAAPGAKAPKVPKAKAPKKPATPRAAPRLKIVWAVCDHTLKTLKTFPYPERRAAEAEASRLQKSKGKEHLVRAERVPMTQQPEARK
jgi:hypothetical protein